MCLHVLDVSHSNVCCVGKSDQSKHGNTEENDDGDDDDDESNTSTNESDNIGWLSCTEILFTSIF